jgi:hypothetical protein
MTPPSQGAQEPRGWHDGTLFCYGGCGTKYADVPCDMNLPTGLWNRVAVGAPFDESDRSDGEGRGGVLCPACIVKRLAALPDCSVVFADIAEPSISRGHEHDRDSDVRALVERAVTGAVKSFRAAHYGALDGNLQFSLCKRVTGQVVAALSAGLPSAREASCVANVPTMSDGENINKRNELQPSGAQEPSVRLSDPRSVLQPSMPHDTGTGESGGDALSPSQVKERPSPVQPEDPASAGHGASVAQGQEPAILRALVEKWRKESAELERDARSWAGAKRGLEIWGRAIECASCADELESALSSIPSSAPKEQTDA